MKSSTLDSEIVSIGKKCFPLTTEACREFFNQVKRIAKQYGLKYREQELQSGLQGWYSAVRRPVIYRIITNIGEDKTDLSNRSVDDIVRFEDDHFIVKEGYDELARDIRDLYETFAKVRGVEKQIKKNQKRIENYKQAEIKMRLEQTRLEPEEITEIMEEYFARMKKCAEVKEIGNTGFIRQPRTTWRYSDTMDTEKYDEEKLCNNFIYIVYSMIGSIRERFNKKANIREISDKFYEKKKREDKKIIVPKS